MLIHHHSSLIKGWFTVEKYKSLVLQPKINFKTTNIQRWFNSNQHWFMIDSPVENDVGSMLRFQRGRNVRGYRCFNINLTHLYSLGIHYIYIQIHTYTYTYIHIYIHIHTHTYIYIYKAQPSFIGSSFGWSIVGFTKTRILW